MNSPLNKLPKGELFRLHFEGHGIVFVKGEYNAASKAFDCYKYEDVNSFRLVKSTRLVFSGFTY